MSDGTEQVSHPDHYGGKDAIYETIKVLEAWLTYGEFIGFCRGQAIAYLCRAGKKGVAIKEDLAKARWYIAYEIDYRKRHSEQQTGEDRVGFLMNALILGRQTTHPQRSSTTHDCRVVQQGDQMLCRECGIRWDTNGTDPPVCPIVAGVDE